MIMEANLFDVVDALSYKYECFHLITPNLDIMGQSPLYRFEENRILNEFMWVITVVGNRIKLTHCMSGFENDHYDHIIITLPINGYPPDELSYFWETSDGVEYEDSTLLIIRHKNTEEEVVRIEFFN